MHNSDKGWTAFRLDDEGGGAFHGGGGSET